MNWPSLRVMLKIEKIWLYKVGTFYRHLYARAQNLALGTQAACKIKFKIKFLVLNVGCIYFISVQGVPLRIEVGPRDLKAEQAVVVRRDNGDKVSVR